MNSYHLYRHEKIFTELQSLGLPPGRWLITEQGIDFSGNPQKDGWQAQGISEGDYLRGMLGVKARCDPFPQLIASMPFIWNHPGWPSFNFTQVLSRGWALAAKADQSPPVGRPLPSDEPVARVKTIASKVRWWNEEYARQVEKGDRAYAEEIMYSLINLDDGLLYRLERALERENPNILA